MGVLKPETNRPIELSFKFITGKDCDSEYSGPQKLFTVTLATGETAPLYLSEGAGRRIEELLASQQIRPGEFVDFCKAEVRNGNRKSIEYQIKRVNPPAENGNGANGSGKPPAPVQQAPAISQPPQPIGNGNNNNNQPPVNGTAAPIPPDRPKTKLEDALITTIAAVVAARKYAESIGFKLPEDLSWEDLRTMANTICMNGHSNGGAR